MKLYVIALLFATLALGCVNYKVSSLYASLRAGPSATASLKSIRVYAQKLCIIEITGEFAKIDSGLYVKTDSIKPVDKNQIAPAAKLTTPTTPATPTPTPTPATPSPTCTTMYVTADALNQRTGPGTTYATSGTLSKNTAVCVVSSANGWAKLDSGKYVSTTYLSATKPTPAPAPAPATSTGALNDNWEFLKLPINKDFGITDDALASKFLVSGKKLCDAYGLGSVSKVKEVIAAIRGEGVSPAFFLAYAVNENAALSTWAGGYINHWTLSAMGARNAANALPHAKKDAKYVKDTAASTSGKVCLTAAECKFKPTAAQEAKAAETFKNWPKDTIGRVYMQATAAVGWELFVPGVTMPPYTAPLTPLKHMRQRLINWGCTA